VGYGRLDPSLPVTPLGFEHLRPSADRTAENGNTRLELGQIGPLKKGKKGVRPVGHRSVEWRKAFVSNKTPTPGWVAG